MFTIIVLCNCASFRKLLFCLRVRVTFVIKPSDTLCSINRIQESKNIKCARNFNWPVEKKVSVRLETLSLPLLSRICVPWRQRKASFYCPNSGERKKFLRSVWFNSLARHKRLNTLHEKKKEILKKLVKSPLRNLFGIWRTRPRSGFIHDSRFGDKLSSSVL